jgi:Peptidase family M28
MTTDTTDYDELLRIFSVPRPSGSAGERATLAALRGWLARRGIAHTLLPFRLYPFSNELIGAWLLGSAALLTLTMLLRWPWPMLLVVAAAMAAVITTVLLGWPLVTWLVAARGENVLITLGPEQATQELVIATHYDSKTELFDHVTQGRLFRHLTACIGLAGLTLLLGAVDRFLLHGQPALSLIAHVVCVGLSLPVLLVVGLVGVNLIPGRLIRQSQGAVDNGAACCVVLGLAARLAAGVPLGRTRVTLALFGGEEVSMQGSRAYVRGRAWPLPTRVVNLELLGQDGPYVLWRSEGNVLTSVATDAALGGEVAAAALAVTGRAPDLVGGINSDGYRFIQAGLPTCVLGSYDRALGGGGLHRPTDSVARVVAARLPEAAAILERWVRDADAPYAR